MSRFVVRVTLDVMKMELAVRPAGSPGNHPAMQQAPLCDGLAFDLSLSRMIV
jgi:hypothetical protein